jgi:hypothetical protein
VQLDGWGVGNVFNGNVAHVDGGGFGFSIEGAESDNTVRCNNKVVAAKAGFADVPCT